jgi:dihydroorotase
MGSVGEITITRPDDWHVHVRDGSGLVDVVPHVARQFRRAIIMPNLLPPITTVAQAVDYRERVLAAAPSDTDFEPLMTLYLTDTLPPAEIRAARAQGVVAAKLYPVGATTNSESGVTNVERIVPTLEAMEEEGLLLLLHGEVVSSDVDIFDRETRFLDDVLTPLLRRHPGLRVVLEHISTQEAVEFVKEGPANLAATVTAHHLLYNRNDLLVGGIRPHHFCLPVVKRERHRRALLAAATGGDPRFFLGTDSAPHPRDRKETACGAAGCFTSHAAIELYAEAFEQAGALDRLEPFAAFHGADFYGLPRNEGRIRLVKEEHEIPPELPFGDGSLVPLRAGQTIAWRMVGTDE